MKIERYCEGLDYPARELQKYILATGIFTISLKKGNIVHFSLDNTNSFTEFDLYQIVDIRDHK